ncbi:MAG: TRAP transporter substrate-binding protein [Pseudomonadales bacterium]|nr:TRAP transporter substrate-binding protein [Pseudomonadales bacterium]
MISNRSALFAVVVALILGVFLSLGIRPPSPAVTSTQAKPLASVPGQQIRHRWRVPIYVSKNLPVLGDNPSYVAEVLERASGGAIMFNLFDPGEIVPAFSITDAVRGGKVQAGYTWLGYDQGKIPASALIGAAPFGLEPWAYMGWWYNGGGQSLTTAIYKAHNLKPILCGMIGPETAGWFRTPIKTVEDFRGLKIRFAGLGGKVLQRMGASVTMLPGGEIFQALEKGAIDATEFSLPVVDQALGFARVAPNNYFPGWHQPHTAAHLIINLEVWSALSGADQSLIELACTAGVARNLAHGEAVQGKVVSGFEEQGVTARYLSSEILLALKSTTTQLLNEEAENDADFARVLSSQRAFEAEYAQWKRFAYLPSSL